MEQTKFERGMVDGIRVHVLPTDRFKTFAISIYIGQPLREDTVTLNALTPFVLRRGTASFPETIRFRERLDDLYGAGFGFDIYKRGDYQIVQFRMDVIHDEFVKENGSLLEQSLAFLGETLTKPALENGRFLAKYVSSEKVTLQKRLESIINDKIRYAAERCIEEMCKDEPYRLHPLGKIEAIEPIDAEQLYHSYLRWLNESPIDIYVVGNTTFEEVSRFIRQSFDLNPSQRFAYQKTVANRPVREVKRVVERMEVGQGKLNMGLRTHVAYADDQYPAMLMYNGILGGYPHSKLFVNVREKASLAYYASSRLDGHKGIMTIQSGIEIGNYDKAVDIIQQQLDAMRGGRIQEIEISQTRAMIGNHLREMQDSAFEMIAFDFNSVLSGRERTLAGLIEEVNAVDLARIREAAERVELDTIYFLRDNKGE